MIRCVFAIVSFLCLWVSAHTLATTIAPVDVSTLLEPPGISAQDRRFTTALLFDFSPFTAPKHTIVPGFADPLGTGVDPELRIFAGRVYFMDLLGDYQDSTFEDSANFELPPGALQGIDVLDDLSSMYLSYDGRAFDSSLFNLQSTKVIERNGLPVTSETSPLSLSGFGSVSDNFNPFNVPWSRCPSQDKRTRMMAESIKLGRGPCSAPGACQCYGN